MTLTVKNIKLLRIAKDKGFVTIADSCSVYASNVSRADTVRREWRYWMNTKKAFPSSTGKVRERAQVLYRDYYSEKLRAAKEAWAR